MSNKILYVVIFLKAFGKEKLIKKKEYPRYHEKKIVAHPDAELDVLYSHADPEEWFMLDFFLGTMVRTRGLRLPLRGYHRHNPDDQRASSTRPARSRSRPRLAEAIQERRKHSKSELLFPQ